MGLAKRGLRLRACDGAAVGAVMVEVMVEVMAHCGGLSREMLRGK
jgi:hypothetical protein